MKLAKEQIYNYDLEQARKHLKSSEVWLQDGGLCGALICLSHAFFRLQKLDRLLED